MSHILHSAYGNRAGYDSENRFVIPAGVRIGDHGAQMDIGSSKTVALLDDFTGPTIDTTQWTLVKGSDAATVNFANAAGVNGRTVGTCGAGAGATMAVNGVELCSALQWQAQAGGMAMEARLQISAITNIALFVGFTDKITLEMPANGSGVADGVTTNANDCVGFLFDTAMTTKNLWLIGSAANVDATKQNSAIAPVAATDITLRVEVTKTGVANFFINGKSIGTLMSGAVTKTVSLTPVVAAFTRSAASATVNVDYVYTAANRI